MTSAPIRPQHAMVDLSLSPAQVYEDEICRHLDAAASLNNVGVAHHQSGDIYEALLHYAHALELFGTMSGSIPKNALSNSVSLQKQRRKKVSARLVGVTDHSNPISITRGYHEDGEASPSVREARVGEDCATTLFNAALVHIQADHLDDAAQLLRLSLDSVRTTLLRSSRKTTSPPELEIAGVSNLGFVLYARGQYAAASVAYREAVLLCKLRIEVVRQTEGGALSSPLAARAVKGLVRAMTGLARAVDALGRHSEAMVVIREASSLCETMEEVFSINGEEEGMDLMRDDALSLRFVRACIHQHLGEYRESIDSFKSLLTDVEGTALAASAVHGVGEILLRQSEPFEAMAWLIRALTLRKKLLDEQHEDTAETFYLIGRTLHQREEYVDALSCYQKALDIQRSLFGEDDRSALWVLRHITAVQRQQNDLGAALWTCREALAIMKHAEPSTVASIREEMLRTEVELLEEMARTEAVFHGGRAERRLSKPGSYTSVDSSHEWFGRCPDAAAA